MTRIRRLWPMLGLTGCEQISGGPYWVPRLIVGVLIVGVGACFLGWRYFIAGQRQARRDDRRG